MNLKPEELVKALRCCVFGVPCQNCPEASNDNCMDDVHMFAADLIERLTAENAKAEAERDALTEQIKERHDCMNCKHNDFCDFDSYTFLDCMNCVLEVCPCAGCFDSSRWEWRGLPEAPEEGEKALAEMEGKA